jgi:hypothetical protein
MWVPLPERTIQETIPTLGLRTLIIPVLGCFFETEDKRKKLRRADVLREGIYESGEG